MKNGLCRVLGAIVTILILTTQLLIAQATAFTYQGRLNDGSGPANGIYDLRFTIYDSTNLPGTVVAGPLTNSSTIVSNGLFAVALDFGPGVFTGPDRWLEIAVRTNGAGAFTALAARQLIAPTPYSLFSQNVNAGGLSAGTYGNAVTFNNGANSFRGSYLGNGAGLTNVNALTLGGIGANGFWRTSGNAGTTPAANFIGTTDNQPWEIHVNSTRALRIEPNGISAPSLVGGYFQNSVAGFYGAVVAGGGADASVNLASGDFAFVGAGYGNTAGFGGAVVAGAYNINPGFFSFLGAGAYNTNSGDYSFLGSGVFNTISTNAPYSTLGGGYNNIIQSNSLESTIVGGHDNAIQSANFATIGGGGLNTIQTGAFDSVISGGGYGMIGTNAHSSFIGGGGANIIQSNASYATIGGGNVNIIQPDAAYSTIGGGANNTIQSIAQYGTIAGGLNNTIQTNAGASIISGGHDNTIQSANFAAIGGGGLNVIQSGAFDSVIAGGGFSTIETNAHSSFIGGGGGNDIQTNAPYSVIGGGYFNTIQFNDSYSFIGGGSFNTIQTNALYSAIVGGLGNTIQSNAAYSMIGAGAGNIVQSNAYYSVIGGGFNNLAGGAVATVGGGGYNTNTGGYAFIGGGYGNTASGIGAFVGGGGWDGANVGANIASGAAAVIPGGVSNLASGKYSFAAGRRAKATNDGAFVWADSIDADFASTVSNQFNARAQGGVRFVTSGAGMTVDGQPVLISGNGISIQQNLNGAPNVIEGSPYNFVSGGVVGATIGGGGATNFSGGFSYSNSVTANFATVGGGVGNVAGGPGAFVGGGGYDGVINPGNTAMGVASFIGGGLQNFVGGDKSTVDGGFSNTNQGGFSTIGGGSMNVVQNGSTYGVIAGGIYNTNNALGATVGGGGNNNATGQYSTVGGGFQNSASGQFSVLSGGYLNRSTGSRAMVVGGFSNSAAGDFSFAAGQQAQALHLGSFVWADAQNASFVSTVSNQFNVRAGNGLRLNNGTNGNIVMQALSAQGEGYQALNFNGYYDQVTSTEQRFNPARNRWRLVADQRSTDTLSIDTYNGSTVLTALTILTNGNAGFGTGSPTNKVQVAGDATISGNLNFGAQTRQMMNLWSGVYGIGVQSFTMYFRTDNSSSANGFSWFKGGVHSDAQNTPGAGGVELMRLNSSGLTVNGTVVSASDRNVKAGFEPVNAIAILDKVAALPITRWHYTNDVETAHLGPVAQDFYAAFGVGPDDKHIAMVDGDGVALAAIQGLNQKLEQKETEITGLKQKNDLLEGRLKALETIVLNQKSN